MQLKKLEFEKLLKNVSKMQKKVCSLLQRTKEKIIILLHRKLECKNKK
jgi:hypothetical protein